MKAMEHSYGKPVYILMGTVCGVVKWTYLQINHLGISDLQKLLSAVIVAGCCGAASAGGGMILKWGIKYFKEFKRNKNTKKFFNGKK